MTRRPDDLPVPRPRRPGEHRRTSRPAGRDDVPWWVAARPPLRRPPVRSTDDDVRRWFAAADLTASVVV